MMMVIIVIIIIIMYVHTYIVGYVICVCVCMWKLDICIYNYREHASFAHMNLAHREGNGAEQGNVGEQRDDYTLSLENPRI